MFPLPRRLCRGDCHCYRKCVSGFDPVSIPELGLAVEAILPISGSGSEIDAVRVAFCGADGGDPAYQQSCGSNLCLRRGQRRGLLSQLWQPFDDGFQWNALNGNQYGHLSHYDRPHSQSSRGGATGASGKNHAGAFLLCCSDHVVLHAVLTPDRHGGVSARCVRRNRNHADSGCLYGLLCGNAIYSH